MPTAACSKVARNRSSLSRRFSSVRFRSAMSTCKARFDSLQLERLFLQFADEGLAIDLQQRRLSAGGIFRHCRASRQIARLNAANARQEIFRLGRFQDKAVRPKAERELFILRIGVGGGINDERDLPQTVVGLPMAQEGVAVHDRHEQVRDDEVRRLLPRFNQGFGAVPGRFHGKLVAGEQRLQVVEVVLLVIDDEDKVHGASSAEDNGPNRATWSTKLSGLIGFSM